MKIALLFSAFLCCNVLAATQYYVDTNGGNDNNAGGLTTPFKTITRARDVIASSPLPSGGVVVNIRAGDYIIGDTIAFSSKNSGTASSPIVYTAYQSEKVRVNCGLPVTGWTKVDPNVAAKYDLNENVIQVDLKAQGITNYGDFSQSVDMLELFYNEEAMQVARYPNFPDWDLTAGTPQGQNGNAVQYNDTKTAEWTNATDLWLHGYFTFDWADSYVKVLSIDTATKTFNTDPKTPPQYGYTTGRRYYAINLLEELDIPGEYYLERTTGVIYFYPPGSMTGAETVVSMIENAITLQDTSYITFQNIAVMFARQNGIIASGGTNIQITKCQVANLGAAGIYFTDTTNSTISGCTVFGTGTSATGVSAGDRTTLTRGDNLITGNTAYQFARIHRVYNPGVGWNGVGNTVSYNTIYDAPHVAILGGGNDHLFENNYIHDVCYESSDAGAFYTGRSWSMQGNVLRNNVFKHIVKTEFTAAPGTVQAIYLDDQMSGWLVEGNTVTDSEVGMLLGGGRNNTVSNNKWYNNGLDIEFDNRGMNWQSSSCAPGGQFEQDLQFFNYLQPPWSTRYPWLATYMKQSPCVPVGNIITGNTYCNGTFIDDSDQTIVDWQSVASNNTMVCP